MLLQVNVEDPPLSMVVGFAVNVTVGAAAGGGGGAGGGGAATGAFFLQPPASMSSSRQKTAEVRPGDFRLFIILLLRWIVDVWLIGL